MEKTVWLNMLATFQKNIAKYWLGRGLRAHDQSCKFFFFFSGFNALYFLWSQADDVRNSQEERAGEELQIRHLLSHFSEEEAERVLVRSDVSEAVEYFGQQRTPIQRMDKRDPSDPAIGDIIEGRKWRTKLAKSQSHQDRLIALGSILYLVRCNLVHGSKSEGGDDEEVIRHAGPVIGALLDEAIKLSEKRWS